MVTSISTGVVARPGLMELLDRGALGPITVVAASAGSGKTVLVRSWLQGSGLGRPAAWVSVERGEHDAQRFWRGLIAEVSLATVNGPAITPLEPTPRFDGEAIVRRLVSDLRALESPLVLVIDDLHELDSTEARDQVSYFLDQVPSNVHVVLISRRDPQLGLHRRRVAGELTEIRSADLRFTLEETRDLLSSAGITLSAESLGLLHDRTEGWVAGLRLAAMSLVSHPAPDRFVAEFSGSERTVAEYLLAEVLETQPAHVRHLLVRTSLLERVNGALGDLLTGGLGAERALQELADSGGFVVTLDASRTWFRFHHLFADLLRAELRNTEPDEIPRLHGQAADWFAENGFVVEAIRHAQGAGDSQRAVGLLIEHYFSLALDGRRATARALLERMDPAAAEASPELATVLAAEQLIGGSLEQAAAYLGLAERHRAAVPEERRERFEMARLVTRLLLARRRRDFRSVVNEASPALTVGDPRDARGLAMLNDMRALALMDLGIVEVWSGQSEEGIRHLEAARKLAEEIRRPYLQVQSQEHLAHVMSGRSFTRAREAALEVIALAEGYGWGADPVIGLALVTVGSSLLQAGRFEEAEEWMDRAESTLHTDLQPAAGFQLHLARGGLRMAGGRYADAIACFQNAERVGLLLASGSPLARQLRSSTLRAWVELGELAAVREALAEMPAVERESGEGREAAASLALAEGDPEAAAAELAPTLSGIADVHHPVVVVRSLLIDALAQDALGDRAAVEADIERALDIAEADTLILPFTHVSSGALLERHPRHRTAHGALITLILDVLSGRSAARPAARPTAELEPLSDGELRVLRFLPTNLSAGDIASEIYLSIHTVRTHMRHIYTKFGVHTRAEAVARAREHGLLGR